jgi:hypothetical protein
MILGAAWMAAKRKRQACLVFGFAVLRRFGFMA